MDNTVELINAAGRLLQDRNKRATGWFAFDADGVSTHPRSTRACRFCLAGALRAVSEDDRMSHTYPVVLKLFGLSPNNASIAKMWDDASLEEQDKIVETLINYKG